MNYSNEEKIYKIILKNLLYILLIPSILTFSVYYFSKKETAATYSNSSTVMVSGSTVNTLDDVQMYQIMVNTYSELAKSTLVLDDVTQILGGEYPAQQIKEDTTLQPLVNAQMLKIVVVGESAEYTTRVANQIAESLKKVGKEIHGEELITIIDSASEEGAIEELNSTFSSKKLIVAWFGSAALILLAVVVINFKKEK